MRPKILVIAGPTASGPAGAREMPGGALASDEKPGISP